MITFNRSYSLTRHVSPAYLISVLRPRLPYSLPMLRLLENAHKCPTAVYLANIEEPEDESSEVDTPALLFVAAFDLSNAATLQEVRIYSSLEEQQAGDRTSHPLYEDVELYVHELLRVIGSSIPENYQNNQQNPDIVKMVVFASHHALYVPIIKKLGMLDWTGKDFGKIDRYTLFFNTEEQVQKLGGYAVDDCGAPILPKGYSWGEIKNKEEMEVVQNASEFPRSLLLLEACPNAGIFYSEDLGADNNSHNKNNTTNNNSNKKELAAWIFERLDGASVALLILKQHRKSGLGFALTYEIMRRAAARKGSKGVWWHWGIRDGNTGSEKIMEKLEARKHWKSTDFGIHIGNLRKFAQARIKGRL